MSYAEELEFYKHQAEKLEFYMNKAYELYEELQHYKDLEEQGRLIKLPCKVGDTAWQIFQIPTFTDNKDDIYAISKIMFMPNDSYFFGKSIFATKEEAERKLAELKGTET